MVITRSTTGSTYNKAINELIDKDERFSELPEGVLNSIGDTSNYEKDGAIEIYKYGDECPDF